MALYSADALAGKRILVTGGGTGLGKGMAKHFASLGAEVHLWGRRIDVLNAAAAEINADHAAPRAFVQTVDIRKAELVDAAVGEIFEKFGPLTGLVNNAAANFIAPTKDISPRAFEAITSTVMNGAFFTTRVENAQVQTLALTSGGVTSLQNASQYTVKGFETEINWFATEGLLFSLSGVYLDGKYADQNLQAFDPVLYLYLPRPVGGNDTVRTPKYSGTAAVNYTFPIFFGLDAELGTDVYYNDGYFFDTVNTLRQESYYILNARAGIYDPRSHIRVTLFGKNLTDELFFSNKYRQDFGDTGIFGAARTYGVTLNWDFGS